MSSVLREKQTVLLVVKKLPPILYNPKLHYPVNNSRPLFNTVSQISPAHALTSCLLNINFISSLNLLLDIPSPSFPSSSHQSPGTPEIAPLISFSLILPPFYYLLTQSHSSPLRSFLQSPVPSTFTGPDNFLNILFANFLSLYQISTEKCNHININKFRRKTV